MIRDGARGALLGFVWVTAVVFLSAIRSASADEPPPTVRRVVLPEPRRSASGRDWADIDAAAGEPPSAAHPYGTVVVAEAIALEPSPSVTEWDIADGTLVRSAALPLSAAFCDLRIVRAGDTFHVVATEERNGQVDYVRLGRQLELEGVEALGAGERPRIATDGSVVAILWSGTREHVPERSGWQLLAFDALGEPIASRFGGSRLLAANESTYLLGNPLAVAAGRVFVLLPDTVGPRVLQISPDGMLQGVHTIPGSSDDGRLFVVGDRVYFTDDCRAFPVVDARGLEPPRASPIPLPGRPKGARACTAFETAPDVSGRLLTTAGEVLDTHWRLLHRFVKPEGLVMRALWLHGHPAVLVAGGPGGRASVEWSLDASNAEDVALPETLLLGEQKR
jgi:hypothetical protein